MQRYVRPVLKILFRRECEEGKDKDKGEQGGRKNHIREQKLQRSSLETSACGREREIYVIKIDSALQCRESNYDGLDVK